MSKTMKKINYKKHPDFIVTKPELFIERKGGSMTERQTDDLEETVIRLHAYLRRLENENERFKVAKSKIEKKGPSVFTQKQKVEASLWGEYKYFKGKLMSYMFVLEQLGVKELPAIIWRLRGMKKADNRGAKIIETK